MTDHVGTTQKIYRGIRVENDKPRGDCQVTVNDVPLEDLEGIGFDWGGHSRLAVNLAKSIICDYFEDEDVPRALYKRFAEEVVFALTDENIMEWEFTGDQISQWVYRVFEQDEGETQEPETTVEHVQTRRGTDVHFPPQEVSNVSKEQIALEAYTEVIEEERQRQESEQAAAKQVEPQEDVIYSTYE